MAVGVVAKYPLWRVLLVVKIDLGERRSARVTSTWIASSTARISACTMPSRVWRETHHKPGEREVGTLGGVHTATS